jgi:uncharacterized sulfatase
MKTIIQILVFLTLAYAAHATDRPNILWLIAEDLGPHLGCYGTKEVSTPHLDRLAAAGRLFHGEHQGTAHRLRVQGYR